MQGNQDMGHVGCRIAGGVMFVLAAMGFALPAQSDENTLVVGLLAEPVSFDVPQVSDLNTIRILKRVFEGLTDLKVGTYEIGPGLAESWVVSDDEKSYTFNLRQGVKFHDGTPFDAAAVKYSLERQLDESHPQNAPGVYPYAKGYLGDVESIEVVDDHTVRINLKKPLAPFLQYLAHHALRIQSPASLKQFGTEVATHPAGTGPFKLKEWTPGVRVVLERNDEYWGGAPEIEQLVYVPIIEAQARLSAIVAGEVDVTLDVPPDSIEMLRANPDINVIEDTSAAVWYIVLNTEQSDPPLDNKLVRQAMNYAVNKTGIVNDLLKGTAVVSEAPLSPVYGRFHLTDGTTYPYDPEKAKALLDEAGYPDGFDATFIVPESGSGMQSPLDMATVIQADLAAVGINAKIQTYEWGTYLAKFRERPDMSEMSWNPSIGDPDQVLYMLLHSDRFPPAFNAGYYKNDKVDALLTAARSTSNEDQRLEDYLEAQRIISEDAPWIFIDHGNQIAVTRSRVKNFKLSPNFDFYFKNVSIE